MVMANWVSSRYWPSEPWSTDGEPGIADTTRASTLSSLGSACCRRGAALLSLPPSPLAVYHLDRAQDLREDAGAELRGVSGALPVRANRFS